MMRRRALVTGATGGLGRHLVSKLVNAGYIVRASGRNAHIGQSLLKPNVEFVSGDLNDEGLPSRLAADTDVVFHCAALSSPWGRKEDFVRSNITATQVLVDAALANRCTSFVHVSTPSIYFRYQDQLGIPENAPLPGRFVNAYAETKAEAETVVRRAGGAGLRATIIRPRGIFGEHDTVLIPRLLKVVRNGLMPVFNNGNAIVDVTYAGNVADAMLLCDSASAPSGTFNVTNGEPISVRELLVRVFSALELEIRLKPTSHRVASAFAAALEAMCRVLNYKSEPKLLRYPIGLMTYSQTLDITAARQRLGYVPAVSIDEGLIRFANWYRCNSNGGHKHEAA